MFEKVALNLVEDLGAVIKKTLVIGNFNDEIIAAANLKGKLPVLTQLNKKPWLKKTVKNKRKKIGTVWLSGQDEESRIYLDLIVNLLQVRYQKNQAKKVQLWEESLHAILLGDCEKEEVQELLTGASLKLGKSQYIFVIETKNPEAGQVVSLLRELWSGKNAYVIPMSSKLVALVIDEQIIEETGEQFAQMMGQFILDELYLESRIGFSEPAKNPSMLAQAYKEALEAINLLKRFGLQTGFGNYSRMNLYVMLNSLPPATVEIIRNLYKHKWQLVKDDQELLFTLQKLMEYNLNLSEAARDLFVHRNTLLYRLGKIQKLTGLDYKNFDDMVLLRLLMLINNE